MIAAVALGAMATRILPFIIFGSRAPSPFLLFLGKMLPPAMIGFLVVFCFKNVPFGTAPHGLHEIIATAATLLLHAWRDNMFLSVGAGTAVYMCLEQGLFCL